MPGDYQTLAPYLSVLGLTGYARQVTPRLLDIAQRQHQWMGRNIIDLGCGTGENLIWLAQHTYLVYGMDRSPQMMRIARRQLAEHQAQAELIEQDLRQPVDLSGMDMVLALDVMHELVSLRELGDSVQQISNLLKTDKIFIFDLYTIEGLYERHHGGECLQHEDDDTYIFSRHHYDYERQIQRTEYIIFQQHEAGWQRTIAQRTLRAYPVQAVTTLVQRNGFEVLQVLNHDLKPYMPEASTPRVIIIAKKR